MFDQADDPICAEPAEYARLREIATSAFAAEEAEFWQLVRAQLRSERE